MSSDIKITGLDELAKRIQRIENNAKEFGNQFVSFIELMPPEFMKKYTKFTDINSFFEASGFEIKNMEDFKAISSEDLDEFVKNNTKFTNWKDMRDMAIKIFMKKQLMK